MMHRISLAFALVLAVTLGSPRASEAQPYGAIAYDAKTGAWGTAYDHPYQQTANQRALNECRKRAAGCEIVVRFWGELCGAYATGSGTANAYGSGATRAIAERNAVMACQRQGQGCAPRVWSCNTRTAGNEAFTPTEMCHFWDSTAQAYVTRFCSSR